jgi:hypothetical protein
MRKLSDQTGVQAPSTDYVKGRIVDNQTPINEAINGDIIEFFHRMAWQASITENTLPDNVTNGHQLLQALQYLIELYSKVANNAGIIWLKIPIGIWNMDADEFKYIEWVRPANHSVLIMEAIIYEDSLVDNRMITNLSASGSVAGSIYYNSFDEEIRLRRITGGLFDAAAYDDAIMNRGYITIAYFPNP